jgi:hypothetical protein
MLLTIFLSRSLLAVPPPVQAQSPNPEPGHYLGFISFILHSDYPIKYEADNTTNYIDYEDLWMVEGGRVEMDIGKPDEPWTMYTTDLKPVYVVMDYTQSASVMDPFLDCILGATIDGLARYRLEKGAYSPAVSGFQASMTLKSNFTMSFQKFNAFGSLPGCDKQRLADNIWGSMEGDVKYNSTIINLIQLNIDSIHFNTPSVKGEIGYTCVIPGWVSDSSHERNPYYCIWKAFKVDKSWRKAVK